MEYCDCFGITNYGYFSLAKRALFEVPQDVKERDLFRGSKDMEACQTVTTGNVLN